jgi:hypothetical protein
MRKEIGRRWAEAMRRGNQQAPSQRMLIVHLVVGAILLFEITAIVAFFRVSAYLDRVPLSSHSSLAEPSGLQSTVKTPVTPGPQSGRQSRADALNPSTQTQAR